MQKPIMAQHHLLGEHEGFATSQTQNPQHVLSARPGHAVETPAQAAQHAIIVNLENPVNVQQTHQHDLPAKSPEPLDTQTQSLQHSVPEKPNVPAVVPIQIPEKVERPVETQQTPQPILPEKSDVTQPQIVQSVSPEKPMAAAASQSQPPQSTSVEKHEESTGSQEQAAQQGVPEKSEKPIEKQQIPQPSAPEKPVEAQAQPDTQHVSSQVW